MSLFTEEKKVKIRPEVLEAADYLKTLMQSGTPTIPTQGTADLTPVQQLIMSQLPGMLSGTAEAGQQARDYYSGVLNENYDVFNDPRYEAIRTENERLTRAGQTALRRGAERFGQLDSTPARVGEAEFLSQSGSNLLKSLGELLTYKEGQKERAAGNIQNVPARDIQNVGAITGLADTERNVEQMRADALYQSALKQILFPYQYQAGLANSLMGMPGGVQVTGGGLTDFGFLANMGAQVGGMALGGYLGGLAGGAGGAASKVATPQATGSYLGGYRSTGYGTFP